VCGITGLLYHDPAKIVDPALVDRMCRSIRHRGPDEQGAWIEGNVGIGMTRLSIIDLAGGSQPIHNEDKSMWIVFNGEIYNFPELRKELIGKGHRFYTESDTETILHLYETHGEECVTFLRGMFAFAIWDCGKQTLFLARDRIGKKPLYYYSNGDQFLFGSEIKTILQKEDVPREMSPLALIHYIPYGYVPDPESMFQGIRKLPPGAHLTCRRGEVRVRKYWDVQYQVGKVLTEDDYIDRMMEIFSEAVRIRLISEVPLGAFLSGGIDSSMVVAMMAKHMGEPVKTFSIGFENQSYNELKFARTVSKRFGTDHHEEIVKPDADSIILDLVRSFDEPFADSSAIPTFYVSRMARKHVTVALSGDGGDELFGGYGRYRDSWFGEYSRFIPKPVKSLLLGMGRSLPESFPGVSTLRYIASDDDSRYIWKMAKGLSVIHEDIFSKEIQDRVSSTNPAPAFLQYMNSLIDQDKVTKRMYLDLKTYLPGDIMTKVDRMSMSVSLETRAPILDHLLVEFAATIPPDLKVNGTTTKYIWKKAAERLLPKEIIYREKQGFAIPISYWIKKEWSEIADELVLGDRALGRRNFNVKFLRNLVREHRVGRRDKSYLIWTLMILELWYREYIDPVVR
jgi:asparagine synthase (glutamine-hydrolysing)